MTTVLKLGGSVVTEKDEPETVDEDVLTDVSAAIAAAEPERLVVVHGGGSFGHHHAAAAGVSATEGTDDAAAIREIHAAMGRLNAAVVKALSRRGIAAVPVRPFSLAHRTAEGTTLPADVVETMLEESFVPILHGDVVVHAGKGATILSGDEIVGSLARSLSADRVGLCSGVPGVLDESGDVIDRIGEYDTVADALGGSDATDVTGGMAGKVRSLLELPVPASIFGPGDIRTFLNGGRPGTLIDGDD
ncbi:isopentenyl phosphate kinase [Halorhabdus amylolytica]|uniref:isopentenyl phosphate kinase n=1 Tax=Halorhabdus amylolytica TaxID=2559573 RepID=UPI0010AA4F38|nr:isopentenyl phosphate kinase [Halorhabdus amylolytica]